MSITYITNNEEVECEKSIKKLSEKKIVILQHNTNIDIQYLTLKEIQSIITYMKETDFKYLKYNKSMMYKKNYITIIENDNDGNIIKKYLFNKMKKIQNGFYREFIAYKNVNKYTIPNLQLFDINNYLVRKNNFINFYITPEYKQICTFLNEQYNVIYEKYSLYLEKLYKYNSIIKIEKNTNIIKKSKPQHNNYISTNKIKFDSTYNYNNIIYNPLFNAMDNFEYYNVSKIINNIIDQLIININNNSILNSEDINFTEKLLSSFKYCNIINRIKNTEFIKKMINNTFKNNFIAMHSIEMLDIIFNSKHCLYKNYFYDIDIFNKINYIEFISEITKCIVDIFNNNNIKHIIISENDKNIIKHKQPLNNSQQFIKKFNNVTNNILSLLLKMDSRYNWYICGSIATLCIDPDQIYEYKDIDIYVEVKNKKQFDKFTSWFINNIVTSDEYIKNVVSKSKLRYQYKNVRTGKYIEIFTNLYHNNIRSVISKFHLNCVKVYYDVNNKKLYSTPSGIISIINGLNFEITINYIYIHNILDIIYKYLNRGYKYICSIKNSKIIIKEGIKRNLNIIYTKTY